MSKPKTAQEWDRFVIRRAQEVVKAQEAYRDAIIARKAFLDKQRTSKTGDRP